MFPPSKNRGYNNDSGFLYKRNGMSQYSGDVLFPTSNAPMPQYVNEENTKAFLSALQPLKPPTPFSRIKLMDSQRFEGGLKSAPAFLSEHTE